MHFQPPSQDAVKNKFITSMSMLLIVVSLYVTCYMLFFRTVEVDVTKDAGIEYRGEDGSASVLLNFPSSCFHPVCVVLGMVTRTLCMLGRHYVH